MQPCDQLLSRITPVLARVAGVKAVVLGGSRSIGTHAPTSDYDIGVYFNENEWLDVSFMATALRPFVDDPAVMAIAKPGDWGPWIVGGAWLTIGGAPVDILFRELSSVDQALHQALDGQVTIDYQPGHPHCFSSSIWLAELFHCVPLHDPDGIVGKYKRALSPYPPALAKALIQKFCWEIEFSAIAGLKAVRRDDQSYIAGSIFRSLACAAQALHALNGKYLMNEKGAIASAAKLKVTLPDLDKQVECIWSEFARHNYQRALELVRALGLELQHLTRANP